MDRTMRKGSVTISMNYNSSIRSGRIAAKFFNLFGSIFPELTFRTMGQWEPLTRHFDLAEATVEWEKNRSVSQSEFGDYIYQGDQPALFYAFVNWFGPGTHKRWADSIAVMLDESFWTKWKAADVTEKSIRLMKALATLGNPLYGRGYHRSEFESKDFRERVLKDGRVSRESFSLTPREGIVDLFWGNYLGKAYVDIFGQQALARVKALLNERVGDGFLLVFARDPFHWNQQEVLAAEKNAIAELNHDAFLDLSRGFQPNLNIQPEPLLEEGPN